MLNQNISLPLYEQLKTAIKDDIDAQIYKVGDKLPSEAELEEKYFVSRITVRRAVKELCDEKILERKQGKGTFILGETKQNRIDKMSGFHDFMKKQNKKANTKVLEKSVVKVNNIIAKYLQIEENENVVFLKRVMVVNDKASFVDICYIPLRIFPNIDEKIEDDESLFAIMKKVYNARLESFHKVLSIKPATKELAKILNCKEDDALFNMFKITYNENEIPLFISVSISNAKNTSYVISNKGHEEMTCDEPNFHI